MVPGSGPIAKRPYKMLVDELKELKAKNLELVSSSFPELLANKFKISIKLFRKH